MVPAQDLFVREAAGGCGLDQPVAVAIQAWAGAAVNAGVGRRVVTGQRTVTVLESEKGGFNAILLGDQTAHAGAADQFLTFDHTTQQQANDDQHDGDLDQRESFLSVIHFPAFHMAQTTAV